MAIELFCTDNPGNHFSRAFLATPSKQSTLFWIWNRFLLSQINHRTATSKQLHQEYLWTTKLQAYRRVTTECAEPSGHQTCLGSILKPGQWINRWWLENHTWIAAKGSTQTTAQTCSFDSMTNHARTKWDGEWKFWDDTSYQQCKEEK